MTRPSDPVLVAGAGPVGLTAAAALVRRGVPVTVLEGEPDLVRELRGSTFHPTTLDMLEPLGAAAPLVAQGLVAPELQFRTRRDGRIAQFDFAVIADVTRHPYRVQCEQYKLTRILLDRLRDEPLFGIELGTRVEAVEQDPAGVVVTVERGGRRERLRGAWLVGADGARSAVRRAVGVEFEGFTWPERFLVVSTPVDFHQAIPDLVSVNYVADPEQWHFLLRLPDLWRVMFPVPAHVADEVATGPEYVRAQMATLVPGQTEYEVAHVTLYRVHQRVAATFRAARVLLAGDAAHVNNPLGGMGMNGGIHDAVNLAEKLAAVWHGEAGADLLDRYDRQRRGIALEYVQTHTIRNKQDLEAKDPAAHAEFKRRMREAAADPAKARDYLLRASMIASLRRAEELG
jgi:3-(3-hydroxy-phenyl)propionate hydroxylase